MARPAAALAAALLALAALAACTTATAAALAPKEREEECMWLDFERSQNVTAWEFQAQPHRHKIRDRGRAIEGVESLLRELSMDERSGVVFVPDSRWMAIFEETGFAVSTRHGHPLHRDPEHPKAKPFPWRGLAYLRLRRYKLLTPAGAYVPSAQQGRADLALKMKEMSTETGLGALQVPQAVGDAKVVAKMENDVHCDHDRVTMSPLFRPVSQDLDISRIAGVKQYFPNLAKVAMLDEDEPLPLMHTVHRAKIVWAVVYRGVVGEANLVIKYNTTFEDAVAGLRPKNGELSLRIRREVAEATGTTGEEGRRRLQAALEAVGGAVQAFRDAGWDSKTPPCSRRGGGRRAAAGGGGGEQGGDGGGGPGEGREARTESRAAPRAAAVLPRGALRPASGGGAQTRPATASAWTALQAQRERLTAQLAPWHRLPDAVGRRRRGSGAPGMATS